MSMTEAAARPALPAARRRAAASSTTSLMSVITAAASDPSCDVDKLERMLSMLERMQASDAQRAFAAAMASAQNEMPKVVRDANNSQTKSRYARLEAVISAINPVITKAGFSLSFGTEDSPRDDHYRVVCDLSHEAGHVKRYHADIPADGAGMRGNSNKNATQAFGSSVTYGRRYLTCMIFNVAVVDTADDDGIAAGGDPDGDREAYRTGMISEEQVDEIANALVEMGASTPKFFAFMSQACKRRIARLEDIPLDHIETARSAIKNAKAARDAKAATKKEDPK